jgi:hypothetical protein
MNRRRAYEQVEISFGGNAVVLRPSLRAATILEERFGLSALLRAVDECNLPIISEIILVSDSSGNQSEAALLTAVPAMPLSPFFDAVRQPLADLVSMFIPAPDPKAKPSTGKPLPWRDLYADLYATATGGLGWTPKAAWNATPNEITRAYQAHVDYLVMTGVLKRDGKEPDPEQAERNIAAGLDPEFDRDGLHALKGRGRKP